MPQINTGAPAFRPRKTLNTEWSTFRKGLNLLLRPTELGRDEYAQGDNIMLIGSGVPTGRWGTSTYFSANATGAIRGFGTYVNTASLTNELFALTDEGYLSKKSGASYSRLNGISYPSGSEVRSEQLGGKTYFVSEDGPLATYDGTGLTVYATLSAPTGLTATNLSGATGSYIWSWRVTTLSPGGGETTGSTAIELPELPQDLSKTMVRINWVAPSAATIAGYQIYRGLPGDETFLSGVGASITAFTDVGSTPSETKLSPLTNTTGGITSRFITKYNDRLIMVDAKDRTKLLISGRYPNQGKFSWIDGGGYAYIDPDSGTDITGIAVQPGGSKGEIIVYKDFSHYAVILNTVTIGNFSVLDPTYSSVSTSLGCSSSDTIQIVENDIFYFGRKGLYVTGYEPNFLNIIRTNEISARIRPYLDDLGNSDYNNACALYVNNKYLLSFPDRREMIIYDRERGSFAGIWKLPFGVNKMIRYVDGTGTERWVIGSSESNQVYTFETSTNSDNGTTITKTIRTNKEAFTSWTELKIVELFYILFRNITGTVNINIFLEDRNGLTSTVKTFQITGAATSGQMGFGSNLWGGSLWGKSRGTPVSGSDEFTRWGNLFKSGRLVQIEVSCTDANSNFELLGINFTAKSQGVGSLSSSQRV